jgi:hypothetical protein
MTRFFDLFSAFREMLESTYNLLQREMVARQTLAPSLRPPLVEFLQVIVCFHILFDGLDTL